MFIWHVILGGEMEYGLGHCLRGVGRKSGFDGHDDIRPRRVALPVETEGFPNYSLDSIPSHRSLDPAVDAYSQTIEAEIIFFANKGEAIAVQPPALSVYLFELCVFAQQTCFRKSVFLQKGQADNLLRPRALRALRIARPARVLIRALKPWLRLRLILLG